MVVQPPSNRGRCLSEVVTQRLDQAPAAFLAVRPVGPELVEEDAVLDVREPGALVVGSNSNDATDVDM
jgi:hypothetical protein